MTIEARASATSTDFQVLPQNSMYHETLSANDERDSLDLGLKRLSPVQASNNEFSWLQPRMDQHDRRQNLTLVRL